MLELRNRNGPWRAASLLTLSSQRAVRLSRASVRDSAQGQDLVRLKGEENGRAVLGIQGTRGSVCVVSRKGRQPTGGTERAYMLACQDRV